MGIGSFGFSEMAVIFLIALIVFGPRKLPELGRTLGAAMREFRRSLNQIQREIEEADPVRSMRDEVRSLRDETRSILGPDAKDRTEAGPGAAKPNQSRPGPRPTGPRPRPSDSPADHAPADDADGDAGGAAETESERGSD